MRRSPRLFLSWLIVLAVIFVPLTHSIAMDLGTGHWTHAQHKHESTHHHASGEAQDQGCHHDEAPANDQSAADPCGLCKLHPVCHTAMLLVSSVELAAPSARVIPIAAVLFAAPRTSEPPEAPPRD